MPGGFLFLGGPGRLRWKREEVGLANRDDEIGVDKWLERFGADPVRLSALVFLNDQAAGVAEVAEKLELPPVAAADHLNQLHGAGLIEVVGEAPYGGKVEPRYRATVRVLWSEEDLAEFSIAERNRLLAWIVQTVNADIDEALNSGTFSARDDAHASRTVLQVDEQGWNELVRVHADALDAVFEIQATSAERLAEAKREGISALSAVFCCELPPHGEKPI
jgi:predicted ArsR family transcriptional regulator